MLNFLKSKVVRGTAFVSGVLMTPAVFAQSTVPDFSELTATIDFSTVITGVLGVAGVMVSVYLAIKGSKIVLQMLRGA